MISVARFHFPQVVIHERQKMLFNPVLKKRFKNRPEERVRLKWVEYLLGNVNWNRNRISFETPVTVRQSDQALRADLILYSDDMTPFALIECKSENITLSGKAAEQIARYNTDLNARYLILTNGVDDLFYEIVNGKTEQINRSIFSESGEIDRDASFWDKRGFGSFRNELKSAVPIVGLLNRFWSRSLSSDIRYLAFDSAYIPFPIDQYYRIFHLENESKLAISFVGQGESPTFMVAVLNQKGLNRAVLHIDIEKYVTDRPQSTYLVTDKSEKFVDPGLQLSGYFSDPDGSDFGKFADQVMKLF